MGLSLFQAKLTVFVMTFAILVSPTTARKTVFGDNQVETIKAMKKIVKAIGVKQCTYCHIKKGGKPKFDLDTPNKEIALHMKLSFVDSLINNQQVEIDLPQTEFKTKVTALYKTSGENAGIHLKATVGGALREGEKLPAGVEAKTVSAIIPLPETGESISCMTCHNRKLRFMTESNQSEKRRELEERRIRLDEEFRRAWQELYGRNLEGSDFDRAHEALERRDQEAREALEEEFAALEEESRRYWEDKQRED